MRILHTSDWHIGRTLYGKQRYIEFEGFLDWLIDSLNRNKIDVLIVSGDVFDTTTPSNRAQELYYKFLFKATTTCCRHIIIISGNHDSPSFLNAPREILKHLNIYIKTSGDDIADQVLLLKGSNGDLEGIICCVPYLRDRDIRVVEQGETVSDKNINLINAIKEHYLEVCKLGLTFKKEGIPIIGTGHLFVTGAKTIEGDGVRELYVGSLAHIGSDIFPDFLDYVALGHIHVPQLVGKKSHIRYSGSPIPMGFGEANQDKIVIIVDFTNKEPIITEEKIPTFQKLLRVRGSSESIIRDIKTLVEKNLNIWVEIEFNGEGLIGNLRDDIFTLIQGSNIDVRVIKNLFIKQLVLNKNVIDQDLEELTVTDVFNRCLDVYKVEENQRPLLQNLYGQIVKELVEEDKKR